MSHQVWKSVLTVANTSPVDMPEGARVLKFDSQGNDLCVWYLVDSVEAQKPNARIITHHFRVYGTGHHIPEEVAREWLFMDTVQMYGGKIVFHIFADPATMKEVRIG